MTINPAKIFNKEFHIYALFSRISIIRLSMKPSFFLLTLFLLVALTASESAPRNLRSIYRRPDYLNRKQVNPVPDLNNYPKIQDWKRDIVCQPVEKARYLPSILLTNKGKHYLKQNGVNKHYLLMYCVARSQSYHILVYMTNQGLMRLNIFQNIFSRQYNVVDHKILDPALVIDQNIRRSNY